MPAAVDAIIGTFHRFPHNRTLLWCFGLVAESYSDHHTVTMVFFWWGFAFGKCLDGSWMSNHCSERLLLLVAQKQRYVLTHQRPLTPSSFAISRTVCDGSVYTRVLKSSRQNIAIQRWTAFINTIIAKCLVNFSCCFDGALVQFEFMEKNWTKITKRHHNKLKRNQKIKFGKKWTASMYRAQNLFSINQYVPRYSRINIYWDIGIQKHMVLRRTKLLKQPNIKAINLVQYMQLFSLFEIHRSTIACDQTNFVFLKSKF